MHATTATCLLGGSGNGPEKPLAYASLFFRYSSVTDINRLYPRFTASEPKRIGPIQWRRRYP